MILDEFKAAPSRRAAESSSMLNMAEGAGLLTILAFLVFEFRESSGAQSLLWTIKKFVVTIQPFTDKLIR